MIDFINKVAGVWLLIGTALGMFGLNSVFNLDLGWIFSQEFLDALLVAVGALIDFWAILKSKAVKQAGALSAGAKSQIWFLINPAKTTL